MTREKILAKLNEVIQDVFDDENIEVTEMSVASDIDGWDSLMNVILIGTVEDEFNIKFAMKDITDMKSVGQMVDLIMNLLDR